MCAIFSVSSFLYFTRIFSGVVGGLFYWVFCEKWCFDVVFLWSVCGELRGKRG